jgi:hypothetical protein
MTGTEALYSGLVMVNSLFHWGTIAGAGMAKALPTM